MIGKLTIEQLIRHGQINSSSNILELGCGWGRILIGLKYYTQSLNLNAIDISLQTVTLCKKIIKEECNLERINFNIGIAEQIPYQNNIFDSIVSVRVFQFLPDPKSALIECKRVLKPNGRLAIIIPNILNPHQCLFYRTKLYHLHTLKNMLLSSGYSDILYNTYRYIPINLNYNSVAHKIEKIATKIPFFNLFGGLIVISGKK
jgi:ubiquinone/menaquinone biosynthesis C-methylase UbiE